ncbi:kanadaptin [Hylaeus volcanicus]|uniref:kanadaptin n=1 Tax=Hylaeus volcanicus TaxID=313075 RepID=UPI0023B84533|nr:kanadaptin [Hylaeus volcanicus]
METKIDIDELTQVSKQCEHSSQNHSDDENKNQTEDERYDDKASDDENIVSSTKRSSINDDPNSTVDIATFKKPTVLISPKRSRSASQTCKTSVDESTACSSDYIVVSLQHPNDPLIPYIEPPWSGIPENNYEMEVLKSGVIVETVSLSKQNFYTIGRLPSCHISLAHPTISRYHAVLQYRSKQDEEHSKGFYIYDLGSTHGTFWNGNLIKPHVYVRVRGGHMLRFGCSQRKYILQAPSDDREEESDYTVSQLKEMRAAELEKKQRTDEETKASVDTKERDGIDWGMGEDADEETDLQENPYACVADENLVLEDPKKTLRGWFEREGYDLQYKTEEKGPGQFLCWVDLPMEEVVGRSIRAEALVKGKKKESVVQCALEACKILDKYGLLRQANHEARKRKTRNWEAEDFYDSDEDNFLDRTGSIEKKREQRMRLAGKLEEKVETYDSLLENHTKVTKRISHLSNEIQNWQNENNANKETTEEDALDIFMSSLNSFALTKNDIAKMKLELQTLRKEEASLIKLLNLTRPANLPALITTDQTEHPIKTKPNLVQETSSKKSRIQHSELYRRKKKQANHPVGTDNSLVSSTVADEEIESEQDSDVDDEKNECLNLSSLNDKESSESCNSSTVYNTNIVNPISDTTTPTTTTTSVAADITTVTINKSQRENEKKQKNQVEIKKKHRREQQKAPCDQEVYANNYSMWVPPQDQLGDGKTSLNEKYGY